MKKKNQQKKIDEMVWKEPATIVVRARGSKWFNKFRSLTSGAVHAFCHRIFYPDSNNRRTMKKQQSADTDVFIGAENGEGEQILRWTLLQNFKLDIDDVR